MVHIKKLKIKKKYMRKPKLDFECDSHFYVFFRVVDELTPSNG